MDEKQELSRASCLEPFDVSTQPFWAAGMASHDGPVPGTLCIPGSWHRTSVIPRKENLLWVPGEQNETTPGRMRNRDCSGTADPGISLQSQRLKNWQSKHDWEEEEGQTDTERSPPFQAKYTAFGKNMIKI